jgi:hypothetical protein
MPIGGGPVGGRIGLAPRLPFVSERPFFAPAGPLLPRPGHPKLIVIGHT